MIELLSLVAGGIFRLLPSVMDLFHKKADNEHELAMVDKQIALAAAQSENKRAEIAAQTDANTETAWSGGLLETLKGMAQPTGVAWIDALSASVRPILTYWWCLLLYGSAKTIAIVVAFQSHAPLTAFIPLLVTDFDRSVIGSILGFWFVDRALRKMGR